MIPTTEFQTVQITRAICLNFDSLTCDYCLPNDFNSPSNHNNNNNKYLSILNLNIRSIANKFDSFNNLLSTLKHPFSIISLTETWLNDHTSINFNLNNYNFVSSNRAKRKGGGVGLYVSNNLNYKIRTDLNMHEEGIIESLFIEIISATSKNIIVVTILKF